MPGEQSVRNRELSTCVTLDSATQTVLTLVVVLIHLLC